MVIVAFPCRPGVELQRLGGAIGRNAIDAAFEVEKHIAAIARPIRCFDVVIGPVDRLTLAGLDGDGLELVL